MTDLSFLPLPRTCSASFHGAPCLLTPASPSQFWPLPPPGSISSSGKPKLTNPAKFFEGLQSAPSVWTCSVTEVPYHYGEPRAQWQDTTGYACWGKTWKKHHFQRTGNFTPNIHSGNLRGKANFQSQGYSFQDLPVNHRNLILGGSGRKLALMPPLLSSSPGPRSQIADSLPVI